MSDHYSEICNYDEDIKLNQKQLYTLDQQGNLDLQYIDEYV